VTDCAEALGLVEKLSDGEATTAEKRAAESHLEECSSCRGHLEFLVSLSQEARSMSFPEPPESYWEHLPRRVLDRIDSESGQPSGFLRILFAPSTLRWGALGATLLVVTAVGVSMLREESRTPAPPAAASPPARVPVAPVDPFNKVPKVPEAEATAENQAQAIAEPTAAPPMARDEAAPAPAAPAETVAIFESNEGVVPSLRKENVHVLESANRARPTAAPAARARAVLEDCDALRRAVAGIGARSAPNDGPEGPDARYRLATCSLERYEREATEELRTLAIEDAEAFLAAESEGARAEEIREKLRRIKPD